MEKNFKDKTIVAFYSVFTLFALCACDMDMVPESALTDAAYWKTDTDFRRGTNELYMTADITPNKEDFPLVADVMSDNAVLNPRSTISNGSFLPPASTSAWDRNYNIIRDANKILEKAKNYQSAQVNRFRGEAKFFRAYAYADLVRRFGDVPLIMKTLDIDSEELYAPRTSRAIVMDTVYADLDYAAANLPATVVAAEWGMVTKGAALALKSRAALREGTWNKFHTNANFQPHLQKAKEAALAVIQSATYDLYKPVGTESYKQLFKNMASGISNKEAIWVWLFGEVAGDRYNAPYPSWLAQGTYSLTRSLADSYLCTDGLPIDKSPLYQGQVNVLSEFANRDPRMNGAIIKKGDTYFTGIPYMPSLTAPTGYFINKYYDNHGSGVTGLPDVIMIRYAEVLLNYAEAVFELDGAISDTDLNLSINKLRARVGVANLTNSFVTTNGLNMREEIRRERRVELAMEGFRYDDLLRWKTAEIELPKALRGARIFKNDYPGINVSILGLTSDSIITAEPASLRKFDPAKNYLWPIPLNEMALNPNLVQNPNW